MTTEYLPLSMGGGVQCLEITATYSDLAATSGSGAKTIAVTDAAGNAQYIPQGAIVTGIVVKPTTAFSGGSISALTMSVGKSGGSTTYLTSAYDIFAAVADANQQETTKFASGQYTRWQPVLVFTPTGANCSAATAGVVWIRIFYVAPSKP